MKSLWSAFSFLAVVHLLALMMFVGWLGWTNRMSMGRLSELRTLFAPTLEEAAAIKAERERAAEEERLAWEEEVRRLRPPLSSEAQLRQISRVEELELRSLTRLENERQMLRDQFELAMSRIEQREREFDQRRRDWERTIEVEAARRADEQFAKTVKQYESVPPKQGKSMLIELVDQGEREQAVAYLDAMNARAASKILKEFKSEQEIELATRLLEELRTFGVPAEGTQDSPDADAAANADFNVAPGTAPGVR